MGSSKPANTHLKPTLHVPTPRNSFSIEQFKQSHGLPTPSSPTMMAADCNDFFFVPPTPSLSISSSNSSDSGSPCMSSAVLMTPQDSHWSMDDNQMSGTITPLELHFHSNEHTPPMTPSYFSVNPQFLRSSSSPSILLSAANCPSLSPAGESQELDFCDPRNLTYPTPSPGPSGPSFSELNIALSAVERLPEIKCEDSAFSPAFHFNEFSDSEEDIFGMSLDENDTTNLAQLQRSFEDSEYDSITDNDSVFDDGYLSLPSPPASSRQGSAQPFRREKKRGSKRVKTEFDFDADLDMDEIIMQARQGGVQEHSTVENAFLNTFDSSMTSSASTSCSVTPAPTDMSSCESNGESAAPRAPVVRRGRKQSLTEDPSKTFVCHIPSCGRRFRRQEHLKRHFRSLHTQDKPFSCSECGKKFSRSDNLSQHTRIHGPGAIVMDLLEEGDIVGADGAIKREDGREVGRMLMSPSEVASTLKEKLAGESKKMRRKRRRDESEC